MIGRLISHYRITEKLGQGGMGEVYRAEDRNLSRQVAIKILPDEFAHDAERLARFEREAKLLASLNHPKIAAIHGLEEHEGKILSIVERCKDDTSISILRMNDRQVTPLLNSRFDESCAEFSPDGHWLAYASDESGQTEVYVRPFPGSGGRRQISSQGGSEPLWARDGRELFYRRGSQVWAVVVEPGPNLSAGKPHVLFEQAGYASWGAVRDWDVSPDGKRFLMVKLDEKKPQPVTEMILVQNWFEELKRLCPTPK